MTPPDSNLDKQKKRHRGPLLGIAAALALVALLFFGYLTYVTDPDSPDESTIQEELLPDAEAASEDGTAVTPQDTEETTP